MKTCSRCGISKPIATDFYLLTTSSGAKRVHSYCKACGLVARRENAQRKKDGAEDRRKRESRRARGIVRVLPDEKRCPMCGEVKSAGLFYQTKNRAGDPKLSSRCIPCSKASVVAWQKANPEKKAASDRKQNQRPERQEKDRIRGRLRHAANPAASAERMRKWAEANREYANAYWKEWRKANPEKHKAHQHKHYWTKPGRRERCMDHSRLYHAFTKDRAIYDDEGHKLGHDAWQAILRVFDHKCCYCCEPGRMTIEHLTPLARGGRNKAGNIAPACLTCNLKKKHKTAEQFAPDRAAEIRRLAMLPFGFAEAA